MYSAASLPSTRCADSTSTEGRGGPPSSSGASARPSAGAPPERRPSGARRDDSTSTKPPPKRRRRCVTSARSDAAVSLHAFDESPAGMVASFVQRFPAHDDELAALHLAEKALVED